MGSTNTEKESNTLSGSEISVVWLFVFICTQQLEISLILVTGLPVWQTQSGSAFSLFVLFIYFLFSVSVKGGLYEFIMFYDMQA